jgi:lipopolysaccharide heptosyltransferase II
MKTINTAECKRILIFNVNWLGDVLFSTATIRAIRRNFPASYLACVIPSRCYPILKDNPHLDEVIIFDEKDRHKGLRSHLGFVAQLKEKKFDIAFLLHRSLSRTLICRLAGIPQRVGYYTKKRGFLLTTKIPMPRKDSMHRIDYYLNVAEKAGLRIEDRYTEFFFSPEDARVIESFLEKHEIRKGDFLVAINPGGNWNPKRWPREYWARLADLLIQKLSATVIITGGPQDVKLAAEIKSQMREKPVIGCGAFNIKQLGALVRRADLFITADTGPLHIANAVGARNIIALFGPTAVDITGPFPLKNVVILQKSVGCPIPCYEVSCPDSRCMKAITPEDVLEKAALVKSRP